MATHGVTLLMDTTQDQLMLALADERGQIVQTNDRAEWTDRYHSSRLLPDIHALLKTQGLAAKDIGQIGLNIGPGSFTGIRTGVTVARLCGQYLQVPLIAFNTFILLAGDPQYRGHPVTLVLDAYRQQQYRATLQVDTTGQIQWHHRPEVVANTTPLLFPEHPVLIPQSLLAKLPIVIASPALLDFQAFWTPAAMAFFLQTGYADSPVPWAQLEPLYLQMPQISVPKSSNKANCI